MKYRDYNEQKRRGSDGFPIEYYFVDSTHPQYEMPLHWHNEFEFIRVVSGTLSLGLDGEEHLLTGGDIVTVDCGMLHRAVPKDCVYECVVCDLGMMSKRSVGDALSEYISPIVNRRVTASHIYRSNDFFIYGSLSALFEAMKAPDGVARLRIMSLLFEIFHSLYFGGFVKEKPENKTADRHNEMLLNVTEWIEDNLQSPISLSRLAAEAGLSEKYFCRVFKVFTGHTPTDYINMLRIDRACNLLSFEQMTVTEAALSCGFSDMSYFSKLFLRYKGTTPSKWKLETSDKKRK